MQEQAEPGDGPLKGPTSLYHCKVPLEEEASEAVMHTVRVFSKVKYKLRI